MKISQVKIKNFRAYKNETTIDIKELTVFVGKNDVGKSTILEAFDIFFNEGKGSIKLDNDDKNKESGNDDIEITVTFEEFPQEIVIDSTNKTSLESEYLLNSNEKLEIVKRYANASKEKTFIKANHPSNPKCSELLLKKQNELKTIIENLEINCNDKNRKSVMRKAIWEHYQSDLRLKEIEIDATNEDAKNIWEKLKAYMPLYSLFQSDRKNNDNESEVQDPMKLAVKEIINNEELLSKFKEISDKVSEKLNQIASNTLEKLKKMNHEIADSLNPVIPSAQNLKWAEVFKNVSIYGDQKIPINKHGSGVKRLVLLNFLIAEAERKAEDERKKKELGAPNIIYAIEEPETSQHPEHQEKLINALISMSEQQKTQIILTTHSPSIVKMLTFENLNLVMKSDVTKIIKVQEKTLPFPSLNEVNFLAFGESDENYHNELYGYIEGEEWLEEFKNCQKTKEYIRELKNGTQRKEKKIISEYIRHQIHHPENPNNNKYTKKELQESIKKMRCFIMRKQNST